jgi:hypothetical protein
MSDEEVSNRARVSVSGIPALHFCCDISRTERLTTHNQISNQSLHRNSRDDRTVTTACLKPAGRIGLQRPTDL